jgi:phage terminase small subunit
MGVLTEIDMAAFAAYCQSYARWKEAQEHIDSEGSTFETDEREELQARKQKIIFRRNGIMAGMENKMPRTMES